MHAHYMAYLALLSTVQVLVGKLYSAVRKQTDGKPVRDNYVVVFPNGPAGLDDNRFTLPQSADARSRWRYDVRVVATTVNALLQLSDAVASKIGEAPIVAGRSCSRVRLVPGVEEGTRHDPVTDLFYMDMSFEFDSDRSSGGVA